jgi:hypothetical protein
MMNCSNGTGSRTETANVPSGGSDFTFELPATFLGIFEVESVRGREERGESRGSGGAVFDRASLLSVRSSLIAYRLFRFT